jgi:hypothetical protein
MITNILSRPEIMNVNGGMVEPEAFTICKHRINMKVGKTESSKIRIGIFGDVHRDSPACDVGAWKEQLAEWKKDPNMFFIGLGDYHDFASHSERIILDDPKLHESTKSRIDDWRAKTVDEYVQEISFMKDRILGLIEGNHRWKFGDGTTSTQRMCQKLNATYMGITGIIRLCLARGVVGKTNSSAAIDIWCHHGLGGSRLVGGSINRVEQMREVFPNMDMYILGHDHRRLAVPVSCLTITDTHGAMAVKQKRQWLIRSGSYLKGYDPGKANYVCKALMPPSDLGSVTAEITLCRDQRRGQDMLWADIKAFC